jgi:ascorbate-specific PTS system EIIC-type component UlaA
LAPSLTTQVANDLLKDKNINLCHHGLFSFALAGCIGKTVRKCFKQKPKSIEEINMPR